VRTNSRCVLLAEDDPNDVVLLQYAFKQAQVQTPLVAVEDGQEVVDYLLGLGTYSDRSRYPIPRLLVLDLKMPRKSGIDVLEWLKSHEMLRCLPTIMLSSSAHPDDVEKAYQLGVNAFVVKPPGVSERSSLAKMIKDFWLTMNEPPQICR